MRENSVPTCHTGYRYAERSDRRFFTRVSIGSFGQRFCFGDKPVTQSQSDESFDGVLGPVGSVRAAVGVLLGVVLGGVLALILPRKAS